MTNKDPYPKSNFVGGTSKITAAWANDFEDTFIATQALAKAAFNNGGGGSSASGVPNVKLISSFSGATDDAKFTNALSYAGAQTVKPVLQFDAASSAGSGNWTLTSAGRTPFTGMKIIGLTSPGPKNLEIGTAGIPFVNLSGSIGTGSAALFNSTGTIYDVYVGDIAFKGTTTQQFWHQPSGTMYACQFHSLTSYGLKYVFGTPSAKALMTQVVFSGHWTVLAAVDTPFTMGGSDNELWVGGYLNQGGPAGGAGKYNLVFDSMGKTNVGGIYITNNNGWYGIKVTGGSGYGLAFHGSRSEGMNSGTYSTGPQFRIEGGTTSLHSTWHAYVAGAPAATGVIHQTGGELSIFGANYQLSGSASEASPPFFYQTGGRALILGVQAAGSWAGRPQAHTAGGVLSCPDNSVTLV